MPKYNIGFTTGLKGEKMAAKKSDKKAETKPKQIRQSAWEKYDKKALEDCFQLSEL